MKIVKKGLLMVSIAVFIASCKEKHNLKNLTTRNFLYFSEGAAWPFSGVAYVKDTIRGIEKTMSSYTFKNGIPDGDWQAYGHEHEILMKGKLTPVIVLDEIKKDFPDLQRINIDKYTEGDDNLRIDIFLISNNPTQDSINCQQKKKDLILFLLKKGFLLENETDNIYDYAVAKGEF
ncbi:hypothetical protein [Ferruginibacter profundus]